MNNLLNNKFIILTILISGLLTSCGFHLRGAITVPDVMKEVYVGGNVYANDLGKVLFRRLTQVGVNRVFTPEESRSILTITRNTFTRRVLTVDSATKASAYKLDIVIGFEVTNIKGKIILKNQDIRQTREYNIDQSNALASGDQESQLKLEMIQFIVNQMLTRMSIVLRDSE
jgi:LPS-assembly lipoprotein